MFAKLLKHEWKASWATLGIITLSILGLSVLATVDLRLMLNIDLATDNGAFASLLTMACGLFLFAYAVALVVYAVGTQFVLLYRFYKNKFTDEGYLTFTLPVNVHQIFWASFVNMLIWLAISVVTVAAAIVVVLLFGTAQEGLVNTEIFSGIGNILQGVVELPWEDLLGGDTTYLVVVYCLQLLAAPFGLIIPMACITMGAMVAKKYKILAAFGIYYGVSTAAGMVSSVLTMLPSALVAVNGGDVVTQMNVTMTVSLLLSMGLTVGAYFLTTWIMRRKLNLP